MIRTVRCVFAETDLIEEALWLLSRSGYDILMRRRFWAGVFFRVSLVLQFVAKPERSYIILLFIIVPSRVHMFIRLDAKLASTWLLHGSFRSNNDHNPHLCV